jgi:hypothetical protein
MKFVPLNVAKFIFYWWAIIEKIGELCSHSNDYELYYILPCDLV